MAYFLIDMEEEETRNFMTFGTKNGNLQGYPNKLASGLSAKKCL